MDTIVRRAYKNFREINVPPTKKRVRKRGSDQDLSVATKNQVVETMTRSDADKTTKKVVVVKKPQRKSE